MTGRGETAALNPETDNPAPTLAKGSSIPPVLTTDWDTLIADSRQMREGQFPATLTGDRADLLNKLRLLGADRFEGEYDGSGDSGEVYPLAAFAGDGTEIGLPDDLTHALDDFVWRTAYSLHPGFENNEGGYGTLDWNLEGDRIGLSHGDRYVATHESSHSF